MGLEMSELLTGLLVKYCYETFVSNIKSVKSESYQKIWELFNESLAESPYDVQFILDRRKKVKWKREKKPLWINFLKDISQCRTKKFTNLFADSRAVGSAPMPSELIKTHKQSANSSFVIYFIWEFFFVFCFYSDLLRFLFTDNSKY